MDIEYYEIYLRILVELCMAAVGVMYAYWARPFVKHKRSAYVAAAVFYILNFMQRNIEGFKGFNQVMTILMLILPCLVLYLLDDKRLPLQKIFICTIFLLIRWLPLELFSEVGLFKSDFLMSFEIFSESVTAIYADIVLWSLLQYSIAVVLLYLSIRLLHKTYKRKDEELSWQELIMLLTPAGSLLIVRPIIYSYYKLWLDSASAGNINDNLHGDVFRLIFCILSYLSIVVIISFYQQIKENQEETYAHHTLEKQIEETKRHMDQIEVLYDRMRALRHDMGNHISVIEGLVQNYKQEDVEEYVKELKEHYEEITPAIKTGNAVCDIAISEYSDRFSKEGVQFECNFIYPVDLKINAFDMCVILSNALQNAYEATIKSKKPFISIRSVVHDNVFILNVRNSISEKVEIGEDDLPHTTKQEKGHGYGLKNIRSIAHKYKGEIEIKQDKAEEEWSFILNVMLVM